MIGLFAAVQVATAPGGPITTDQCKSAQSAEIVICGTRPAENPYRIPNLPKKYDGKAIRAETDAIPGVHTRAHVESVTRPDGSVAKRLMVTFSIPF